MSIMSALLGKQIRQEIDERVDAKVAAELEEMNKSYHMGIERKYDIRDWNSFTDIQQEILMSQMLGSTASYAKVWVYNICVRKISQTAARINSYSYLEKVSNGETVKGNKIFHMIKNRCNPLNSGIEQFQALASHEIMNGNSYEMVIGTPKMPIELWALLSQNVTPIKNKKEGEPLIKHYRDETGNGKSYPPENIIHTKEFNPESQIIGLPWLAAATTQVETLNNAEDFNSNVLKNGIFPSINWHTDQDIPKERLDTIKMQLADQYGSPRNAGIGMLTHSGFKAHKMAFSPREMLLLENEQYVAAIIAVLLGVNPEIFGMLTDKRTYNNVREAMSDFINNTCLPLTEKINTNRSNYFWPEGDFVIKINEKLIDVFKGDAAELNTSWWLTPDMKLEQQGHAPTGLPEMQERYIPAGFINIKDLGEKEDKENL